MNKSIKLEIRICFYFPYHDVSGVPMMFARIANEIAVFNKSIQIYIIDYADGVMARNVVYRDNLNLLTFIDGITISPPEDCILVMQTILPYSIRPELKILSKTKIVFWTLHPDNLVPNILPLSFLNEIIHNNFYIYKLILKGTSIKLLDKLKLFVELCLDNEAIWFMDKTNLDNTNKRLFLNIQSVEYLPVPALRSDQIKLSKDVKKNCIHFCWIGRLCDFKIYILLYTIKKLSLLAIKLNIEIEYTIIGDGEYKWMLNDLNVNNSNFKLNIIGSLTPSEVDLYLIKNVDVVTAMGTSALEGAKFGIPTILLDFNYSKIRNDYKFRWLFTTLDYDLGHEIKNTDYEINNTTLENIIFQLIYNYDKISIQTLNYFKNNHDISTIANLFIKRVQKTKLTFDKIPKFILFKNIFRRTYETIKGYR
jgi:hypothetical protein